MIKVNSFILFYYNNYYTIIFILFIFLGALSFFFMIDYFLYINYIYKYKLFCKKYRIAFKLYSFYRKNVFIKALIFFISFGSFILLTELPNQNQIKEYYKSFYITEENMETYKMSYLELEEKVVNEINYLFK